MKQYYMTALIALIGTSLISLGLMLFVPAPLVASADDQRELTPFEDFACLNCHTDKTRLTELAEVPPQEEEAALSSGPG